MPTAPLLAALSALGPSDGPTLQRRLGLTQPTFSRLVARHRDSVLTTGRTRDRRYAARRDIAGVTAPIPVYRIDTDGRAQLWGRLHPVAPRGFWWEHDERSSFHADLPWFLHDLRPGGFLGRRVPQLHPAEHYPAEVRLWSGDTVLHYLTHHGLDTVGDLVLGDAALEGLLAGRREDLAATGRVAVYAQRARSLLEAAAPGSSAQGEQPKLLVCVEGAHKLVKFSPPRASALAERVADLLLAEHVALETLAEVGVPAASSTLLVGDERLYLEVERFDRVGALGRRGVVTLEAVDAEHTGALPGWSGSARALVDAGVLSPEAGRRVRWLDVFGALIANTDRHGANLSLWRQGTEVGMPVPAYDMLPMRFAPVGLELPRVTWTPPTPSPTDADVWPGAWRAACRFWRSLVQHDALSSGFVEVAAAAGKQVEALGARVARLPGAS